MAIPASHALRDALRKLPGFSFLDPLPFSQVEEDALEVQTALLSRTYDHTPCPCSSSPAAPDAIVNHNLVVLFRAILYYADFYSPIHKRPQFFVYVAEDCFPAWKNANLVSRIATLVKDARQCFLNHCPGSDPNYESPLPDLVDRYGKLVLTGADPLISRKIYSDEAILHRNWSLKRSELRDILSHNFAVLFDPTVAHIAPPPAETDPPTEPRSMREKPQGAGEAQSPQGSTEHGVVGEESQSATGAESPSQSAPAKRKANHSGELKREREQEIDIPRKKKALLQGLMDVMEQTDQDLKDSVKNIQTTRLPPLEEAIGTLIAEFSKVKGDTKSHSDALKAIEARLPSGIPADLDVILKKTRDDVCQLQDNLRIRDDKDKNDAASCKRRMADEAAAHESRMKEEEVVHQRRMMEQELASKRRVTEMEAAMQEKLTAADKMFKSAEKIQKALDSKIEQMSNLAKQYNAKWSEFMSQTQLAEQRHTDQLKELQEHSQKLEKKLEAAYLKIQPAAEKNHTARRQSLQDVINDKAKSLRSLTTSLKKEIEEVGSITIARLSSAEKQAQNLRTNDYKMKAEGWESKMKKWGDTLDSKQSKILHSIDLREEAQKSWLAEENEKFAKQLEEANLARHSEAQQSLLSRVQRNEESQEKTIRDLEGFSEMLNPLLSLVDEVKPRISRLEDNMTVLQGKAALQDKIQTTGSSTKTPSVTPTDIQIRPALQAHSIKMGQLEKSIQSLQGRQQEFEQALKLKHQEFERTTNENRQKFEKTTHEWTLGLIQSRIEARMKNSSAALPLAPAAALAPAPTGGTGSASSNRSTPDDGSSYSPIDAPAKAGKQPITLEGVHAELKLETKTRLSHVKKLDKVIQSDVLGRLKEDEIRISENEKRIAELAEQLHDRSRSTSQPLATPSAEAEAPKMSVPQADIAELKQKVESLAEMTNSHSHQLREHESRAEVLQEMVTNNDSTIRRHDNSIGSFGSQLREHQKKFSKLEFQGILK